MERGNHVHNLISFKPCLCVVLSICFLLRSSDRFHFTQGLSWCQGALELEVSTGAILLVSSPNPNHGSYTQQIPCLLSLLIAFPHK